MTPNVWALSCLARWPGGSKRQVECQILPWIDWKELWPLSCRALLGGKLVTAAPEAVDRDPDERSSDPEQRERDEG